MCCFDFFPAERKKPENPEYLHQWRMELQPRHTLLDDRASELMESVFGNIIWQLPSAVVGSIITENLSLREISVLDVACCARTERTLYFGALRAGGRLSEVTAGNDAVGWVIKRNVKVVKLKVAKAVSCLAAVVKSHQLFDTIELLPSSEIVAEGRHEPSELRRVLVPLSEIGHKVSFLSMWCFSNGKILPGGASFCKLLTFVLEYNNDTSEWVVGIIKRNTFLRYIEIRALEPLSASLYDALLARRSTLTDLRLRLREELTDALFDRVVTSCPGLRSLDLDCIGRVSHLDISHGLIRLAEGCPGLRELKVIRCLLRNDLANQAMLRGLKNLCVLEVLRAKMLLSDDLLLTLAECRSYPPFLTELEINWSVQRTETVAQVSVVLANLRRLVLHSVAPFSIEALEAGLAHLSQVEDLTLCIRELPIIKLLTAVAEGSPNLRSLSVDCDVGKSAAKGLIEIARHCPLLEKIQSSGAVISDRLLHALTKNCPRFRVLSAHVRCDVTTEGLLDFIQHCPPLTVLELHVGCTVNDAVMLALAQHSYYLEKLCLQGCDKVTKDAVIQLVASCKHLITLWCPEAVMDPEFGQQLRQLSRARGRRLEILPK
jgi:hypothetical protein